MPGDAGAARALVMAHFAGTRYLGRLGEVLDAALQFEDPEYLAVVAEEPRGLVGLVMFGTVAGARQCTRLHALVGADPQVVTALAEAVRLVCAEAHERLVVAEVPDDAPFSASAAALRQAGFAPEGWIDDLVADGIALQLLVWRRDTHAAP